MDHDEKLIQRVFKDPDQKIVLKVKQSSRSQQKDPQSPTWRQYAASIDNGAKDTKKRRLQKAGNNGKPVLSRWDSSNLSLRNPLSSELDFMLCSYCKRPCLTSALQQHVDTACLKAPNAAGSSSTKKRKLEEMEDSNTSINTENGTGLDGLSSSEKTPKKTKKQYKKKKLSAVGPGASASSSIMGGDESPDGTGTTTSPVPKARKKKDKTKSTPKSQKPVDVEKQCGVPLENGQLCARSLTCKTHSMGAKRAVQGRSAPYDVLLSQYQKKNQVKQASTAAQQQLADENEALSAGPINPDEEVMQVMEGVRRSNMIAAPLERKVLISTRFKSHFCRVREMFAAALQPKGTPATGGIGGLFGRANAFNPEQPEQLHFVRPPSLQRLNYLQALRQQQQKQQMARLQAQQQQQQQSPNPSQNS